MRPARAGLRVIAYAVDWLVIVILTSVLVSIGGVQLYLATDAGRRNAPDAALYAFLIIVSLAAPLWGVATLAGWSFYGRSVGKLAMNLRIVNHEGRSPGVVRGLVRFAVYLVEGVPLLAMPLLLLGRWWVGDAVPLLVIAGTALLALLGFVGLLPAAVRGGGRTLHDRLAGTYVIEE